MGAIYGSAGYLDFYINGDINLGFELLRNGVKINGHLDRFKPDGIYKDIPLRDYAVLDFYQAGTLDVNLLNGDDKYYAAIFSADFKSIQLLHNGDVVEFRCGRLE